MKILMVGHFYTNGIRGAGQQIRTSTVSDSIEFYCNADQITHVDLSKGLILSLIKLLFYIRKTDIIMLFPGENALKKLERIISPKYRQKTILIAIGGWLPTYINKDNFEFFFGLSGIFVQTPEMVDQLSKRGLNNVVLFPNYRIVRGKKIKVKLSSEKDIFRMVFCSRIVKEKGIFEIIEATRKLIELGFDQFIIDFYGSGSQEDINAFEEATMGISQISYRGYIDNSIMIETLSEYDVMLFPTYYDGEGFPGVIIESFIAGVPVIGSKWKYNEQYIKEMETGLLCDIKDSDSLCRAIVYLYNDRTLVNNMKHFCKEASFEYGEEKVIRPLLQCIDSFRQ